MSLIDITILTATLLNLVFSATVYLHSHQRWMETVFAIFALNVSLWSLATFFMTSGVISFEMFKVGTFMHYVSGNLAFWFLLWFSVYYPSRTMKSMNLPITLSVLNAVILLLVVFTHFLFQSFQDALALKEKITFDVTGYGILSAVTISMFVLSQIFLARKYERAKDLEKTQIGYLILGTSVAGSLGLLSNLILPGFGDFSLFYLGPIITTPLFVGVIVFAILQYRLFNLRVITAEIFTVLLVMAMAIQLFISNTAVEVTTRGFMFLLVAIFGYLLIRSVYQEVRLRERIEGLDRAKSEFVSIVSHQIRAPLSIVKGYISLIREGSYRDTTKVLNRMYLSNERLIKLVDDLLDLSRMDSGKMRYTFAEFDFNGFVDGIVEEFRIPAADKGIKLVWQKKSAPVVIRGDQGKLRQVVFNLIDNALKYTPKGKVEVKVAEKEGAVDLSVTDSGIGMSQETMARLFKKFSSGDEGLKVNAKSTGLDLYVAK